LTEPVGILLVEDVGHDGELVLRLLKPAGRICAGYRVDTEHEFRKQLVEFSPKIILWDFSMPRFSTA